MCDFNFSTSYCHSPRVYTFILIESARMQAVEQIRFKCSSESGTAIEGRRRTILSAIIVEGHSEFFRDVFFFLAREYNSGHGCIIRVAVP